MPSQTKKNPLKTKNPNAKPHSRAQNKTVIYSRYFTYGISFLDETAMFYLVLFIKNYSACFVLSNVFFKYTHLLQFAFLFRSTNKIKTACSGSRRGDIIKLQMKGIRINPFIFYKPFTGKQFKTHVQIQASLNTLVMILFKITLVTISQLHHKH